MVVRKLREQNNWSQEQLARISGVSLRTIQRVEAGNKASLETLKSLASVFEVDISKLTEEVIVIDKKIEEWKSEFWAVRLFMLGARRRSQLLVWECLFLILGILYWLMIRKRSIFPTLGASPLF